MSLTEYVLVLMLLTRKTCWYEGKKGKKKPTTKINSIKDVYRGYQKQLLPSEYIACELAETKQSSLRDT